MVEPVIVHVTADGTRQAKRSCRYCGAEIRLRKGARVFDGAWIDSVALTFLASSSSKGANRSRCSSWAWR